jgi:transcriptional regulator with XRE-family HTH domain
MSKSVFSDAYAILVAGLVEARHLAGVTQVQLADRLGKPQSFISKIERGERRVDALEFCAIAQALGIKPSELMSTIEPRLPTELPI